MAPRKSRERKRKLFVSECGDGNGAITPTAPGIAQPATQRLSCRFVKDRHLPSAIETTGAHTSPDAPSLKGMDLYLAFARRVACHSLGLLRTGLDSRLRAASPVPMPVAAQPPTHPHHRRADAIGPPIGRWWHAELPPLPPPLPAQACATPARTDAEPDTLPRHVAAPERLCVATLTRAGPAEPATRATEASQVRARSWRLWWAQARHLPTSGERLFVTSCWAPLHRSDTGEWRRSDRWPATALSGPLLPSVLRRSAAAALIHAGQSAAVSHALHGRATEGGTGRAVICNAALQRWDARPPAALAQRMRRFKR